MGGEKAATIHTRRSLFFNRRPLDSQNDIRHARVSWGSALSVPQQPPWLRPDPASTTACSSTTGNRTSSTAPGCLTVPSSTSPRHQGWPARTRAHRHSSTYYAHPIFFSKTPLGFCCKPRPSPCVYKRRGPRDLRGGIKKKHKTSFVPTLAINISSNTPPFSSLETWDRFPLSELVTPTQALWCKEIQNSPPPARRRAFFA
jgi:hypothetical protein